MRSSAKHLWSDQSGAIAAVYALALPVLIAVGGIAFDYARMAALDTELQQAADQAALAAVTQLDGKAGACSRAVAAAQVDVTGTSGLLANKTLFANEAAGTLNIQIADPTTCDGVGNIRFYSEYTDAATNTVATTDATAKFVGVTVNTRKAVFALTPIIAAFDSGDLAGTAVAGLGSAVCKVPPVMICNPNETGDLNFTTSNYIGRGLKLVSMQGQNDSDDLAPGNFGYLNTGVDAHGVADLRKALGWVSPPGDCIEQTGVNTKPGAGVSATDAINTRFDIYDGNNSCPTGGACPASINSTKDLLNVLAPDGTGNTCTLNNSGWREPSTNRDLYLPDAVNALTPVTVARTPKSMGHPRDMCHAARSSAANYCSGPLGTGAWDRNAYFLANYGWSAANWPTYVGTGVNPISSSTPTRYRVYQWEIENRGAMIGGRTILDPYPTGLGSGPNALYAHNKSICSATAGINQGSPLVPGGPTVDRRRISVAIINCDANNVRGASTNVPVLKWVDIFLVEPSFGRGAARFPNGAPASATNAREATNSGEVYVEVISETSAGGNGTTAGQVTRRDKPYLVE